MQVIFRKRATNCRALLRKMNYENKATYDSTPPCMALSWTCVGCVSQVSTQNTFYFFGCATHYNTLQQASGICKMYNRLQRTATHCNTLQRGINQCTYVNYRCHSRVQYIQHTATHCNTLQHTATQCNILQHGINLSTY